MSIKNLVGMRTLKTGIAVTISAYLGRTFLVVNPFYAVIGTILAMQNTVKSSFTMGKNRIIGTVMGALNGFLFATVGSYLFPSFVDHPIYIGLAIIFTIICCNALKLTGSILISLTICFSIIAGNSDPQFSSLLAYTFFRTTDTSIGIIVSLLVNYFILQPNYLGDLSEEIEKIEAITTDFVKNILVHKDLNIENLDIELGHLDAIYKNYSADRKFNKNPVSSQKLNRAIEASHDIYFHAKCIARLSEEADTTELNHENRLRIIDFFIKGNRTEIEMVKPINPIFEYHIHQMLNQLKVLTNIQEGLVEHLENE